MAIRHKKRAARKRGGRRAPFFRPLALRIALALAACLAGLILHFDHQMQLYFRDSVHPRPALLYARAPQLSPLLGQSPGAVVSLLEYRGYRRSGRLEGPGSYVLADDRMDLYPNPAPGGAGSSGPVRLEFQGDRLHGLHRHADGARLDSITLEPEAIGTLQLGPYEDRIALRLHQMPELLVRALLAMEDRNFENHIGVDVIAIARALANNLIRGQTTQGGSTITQQLVKNLFLSPERTLSRKIMEALMAITLELRLSKAEILEHYLNEIFLGQSGNRAVHGFALASEYYFARPLNRLGTHEIATLVGMIPAPSLYNPRRNPEHALARRNLVLSKLAEVGAISENAAAALSTSPMAIAPHRSGGGNVFPAYVDYLHRQVRQYFPEDVLRSGGIRLYTTLDADIQQTAQQALSRTLNRLESDRDMPPGVLQGAAVVVSVDSGDILALVGGRQGGFAGFNRAVDAQRPIGSLVKPLVYLAALERPGRFTLGSMIQDTPLTLKTETGRTWSPQNYDRDFRGQVMLLEALTRSYNVPAVRLGLELGLDSVAETINRLGVRKEIPRYPSTLLGSSVHSPLEIAQLYQSIANRGHRMPLRSISHIDDPGGRVIARFPGRADRVIRPGPAYLIDFALRQVVRSGTASLASRHFPASLGLAGKTGTTDDYRDSWFVGYSGNLVTVVWVGRDDNRPVGLTGAGGAMRVWTEIMQALPLAPSAYRRPAGVRFLELDPATGLLARDSCPERIRIPVLTQSRIRRHAPCADAAGAGRN